MYYPFHAQPTQWPQIDCSMQIAHDSYRHQCMLMTLDRRPHDTENVRTKPPRRTLDLAIVAFSGREDLIAVLGTNGPPKKWCHEKREPILLMARDNITAPFLSPCFRNQLELIKLHLDLQRSLESFLRSQTCLSPGTPKMTANSSSSCSNTKTPRTPW